MSPWVGLTPTIEDPDPSLRGETHRGPKVSFCPSSAVPNLPVFCRRPAAVSGSLELGLCLGRRALFCPRACLSVAVSSMPWALTEVSLSIPRSTFPPKKPFLGRCPRLGSPFSPHTTSNNLNQKMLETSDKRHQFAPERRPLQGSRPHFEAGPPPRGSTTGSRHPKPSGPRS